MLFAYRSGKNKISAKAWSKLERAEFLLSATEPSAHPIETRPHQSLEETQAPYDADRAPQIGITRAEVERRLRQLLDRAEQVPGGLGYIWGVICRHMDEETLIEMRAQQVIHEEREAEAREQYRSRRA